MPYFAGAYDAILGRFKSQMDSSRPNVPVNWPNMEFDPESDFDASSDDAWVRIVVEGNDAQQASLGGTGYRRFRQFGLVTTQVFCTSGKGLETALNVADDVVTALEGVTTSGVRLQASSVTPIGRDGAFYQVNVRTPFQFDNQK